MKRFVIAAALAGICAAPAFAQAEKVTCGDYSAMDNATQMQTIADIESLTVRDVEGSLARRLRDPRRSSPPTARTRSTSSSSTWSRATRTDPGAARAPRAPSADRRIPALFLSPRPDCRSARKILAGLASNAPDGV